MDKYGPRRQRERRGNRSSFKRLLKRLVAGTSVTAVLFLLLAIVLALIVRFGSCRTAATIADLAPEKLSIGNASYTHDRIARAIMGLRKVHCIDVSATVFRFCNDHSIREGSIVSEEAMLAEIKLQNINGPIDKLTLHFTPGVISDTPGGSGTYQEVMEDKISSLRRGNPTSATNTARWQIDFDSEGPIYPEGGTIAIPIHYYAVEARSASRSLTCQTSSRATVISYELKGGSHHRRRQCPS